VPVKFAQRFRRAAAKLASRSPEATARRRQCTESCGNKCPRELGLRTACARLARGASPPSLSLPGISNSSFARRFLLTANEGARTGGAAGGLRKISFVNFHRLCRDETRSTVSLLRFALIERIETSPGEITDGGWECTVAREVTK